MTAIPDIMASMVAAWMWIAVGAGAALGLSGLAGLALGAILGRIGQDIGELLESEPWTLAPPLRSKTVLLRH